MNLNPGMARTFAISSRPPITGMLISVTILEYPAGRIVEVQFVALHHELDPAQNAGHERGQIAEGHRPLVGLEIIVSLGDTVNCFAGQGGFLLHLFE
jgi:hypothetical protein